MTETFGVVVSPQGLVASLDLPNAARVFLCVFDGDKEALKIEMARGDDRIFRGVVPGRGAGALYGFRVEGPHDPGRGLRFDASKLLADPYAWRSTGRSTCTRRCSFSAKTAVHTLPKRLPAPRFGEPRRRRVSTEALLIYELNLRGFSRLNTNVPEAVREPSPASPIPRPLPI